MAEHAPNILRPSDDQAAEAPEHPGVAVGNVPFTFVLLSAILMLMPWFRAVGLVLLLLLAIPALVVWFRARKLADGSRGLTSSTLIIGAGAFILAAALSSGAEAPSAEAVPPPPAQQAVAPPAPLPLVVSPPAPQGAPALPAVVQARPPVQQPAPAAAPAPRVVQAPVPQPAADEQGGVAYYKNCTAARAAGAAPIQEGEPGYRSALDRDGDGTACER